MAVNIQTTGARVAPKSEVNITPFVDVMLVLLIVFMVAAPVATIAVPLNLSRPEPPAQLVLEPVFVSLQDNGVINVGTQSSGEIAANWATLSAAIRQKTGGDSTRQVLVRADQKVPYAAVMRLMEELHRAGYKNKTLVTEDVVD
jgi:biopolymer transport protein ExbD